MTATAPKPRTRTLLRWLLALIYLIAGIAHLRSPHGFMQITPAWVPYPLMVIYFTGLCELAGALGLLIGRTRRLAGIMLAAYAVCVFPANIKHAVDNVAIGGVHFSYWYHVPRLAFQPVIVWWALFAGGVVDWPWRKRAER